MYIALCVVGAICYWNDILFFFSSYIIETQYITKF